MFCQKKHELGDLAACHDYYQGRDNGWRDSTGGPRKMQGLQHQPCTLLNLQPLQSQGLSLWSPSPSCNAIHGNWQKWVEKARKILCGDKKRLPENTWAKLQRKMLWQVGSLLLQQPRLQMYKQGRDKKHSVPKWSWKCRKWIQPFFYQLLKHYSQCDDVFLSGEQKKAKIMLTPEKQA